MVKDYQTQRLGSPGITQLNPYHADKDIMIQRSGDLGLSWRSRGQDSRLPVQRAQADTLLGELRSHMLNGTAQKKQEVVIYSRHTVVVHLLIHCKVFLTPWTLAHQAPLSTEISRQDYWSGWHFLLQGIFLT